MSDTTIVRQKMSVSTVAGYKCAACNVETVTYDGVAPTICLNCGVASPVLMWKNIIRDTTTTETVPFKP